MASPKSVHRTIAFSALPLFLLVGGAGYWQAVAYVPPSPHAPLARNEDPRVGTVVRAALPHPREPFLLVDLGCGCEVVHIDRSLFARTYKGVPLVFALDDAKELPAETERTDPETLRKPLNPWFTPRVYGFAAGGRLAYVQPKVDSRGSLTEPLKEARRALEAH